MEISEYKKLLQKNNIELFDHDIRISHFILNKYYIKEQKGGGLNNLFHNKNSNEIKKLIETSLSPNYYKLIFSN
jgi:hypothetical protein